MSRRGGLPGLFLVFVAAVVSCFLVHEWLGPSDSRETAVISIPSDGLRLAFLSSDLTELPARLAAWPLYRGTPSHVRRALRGAPSPSPGAVASYGHGWIAWTGDRKGPWNAVVPEDLRAAPGFPSRIPAGPVPSPGEAIVLLRPPGILAVAVHRLEPGWAAVLPERAVGEVHFGQRLLRERWIVSCPSPCALALLDPEGLQDVPARGWASVPPDADALAWFLVDPSALEGATLERAWPGWTAAERFLDMPLRAALAEVLAGPAVVALQNPKNDGSPRLLVAFDLRNVSAARSALDRVFALGVLSEALEIARYRGVLIGSWRPPSRSSLAPAVAVDGDVLLMALHADDLRDAIDRRRAGGAGAAIARRRLEDLGIGSWKAWSHSAFLADSWEEILSGRESRDRSSAFDVTAVGRFESDLWVFRSEGGAPLLAAESLLPTARAVARVLRRQQ